MKKTSHVVDNGEQYLMHDMHCMWYTYSSWTEIWVVPKLLYDWNVYLHLILVQTTYGANAPNVFIMRIINLP